MSQYYNREGQPIGVAEWDKHFGDRDYKIVEQTTLPDGKWVSTVWLGLDHGFGDGPPLIFETMVFPSSTNFSEIDMERYATLADAVAGHRQMVLKYATSGNA